MREYGYEVRVLCCNEKCDRYIFNDNPEYLYFGKFNNDDEGESQINKIKKESVDCPSCNQKGRVMIKSVSIGILKK